MSISPLLVSLSRTRKEPCVFPEARRSLMASFLEMFVKNHLQHKHTTGFTLWAKPLPFPQGHSSRSDLMKLPVWRTAQSPWWSWQWSCMGCSPAGLWWGTRPCTTLGHPWWKSQTRQHQYHDSVYILCCLKAAWTGFPIITHQLPELDPFFAA